MQRQAKKLTLVAGFSLVAWCFSDISHSFGLERFEEAITSIRSYEVYYTIAVENHQLLPDGGIERHAPSLRIDRSRKEIWASDGRQRVELVGQDGKPVETRVFNGEYSKTFFSITREGRIDSVSPDQKSFVPLQENYSCLFRTTFNGGPLVTVLRARSKLNAYKNGNVSIIEAMPEDGPYYPEFGFRIEMPEQYCGMPNRIEAFHKGMEVRVAELTVNEFAEKNGQWVPIKGTIRCFALRGPDRGMEISRSTLAVDVQRSTWNEQISHDDFILRFPAGTKVIDKTREAFYITGEKEVGDNLDKLVATAKGRLPLTGPPQPVPVGRFRWGLAASAAIVAAAIGILAFVKAKRAA